MLLMVSMPCFTFYYILLCTVRFFKVNGVNTIHEAFKITVVIDPGKDEHFHSLKLKAEEIFDKVASAETLNITIAMVNAARLDELVASTHEDNPLRITRQKVCTEIMSGSVVVILMHPLEEKSLASATSYALGFYDVPVISISSRDVEFSDKNVYSSFLRTLPAYSQQAEIWYSLLLKLDYYKVIFLYPEEPNALALRTYFLKLTSQNKIECNYLNYSSTLESATEYIEKVNASNVNVILLYANVWQAEMFFQSASDFGLLNSSKLWIVNEQALKASNAPLGLLGVKVDSSEEELRWTALSDAYQTIFDALKKLKTSSSITVPSACGSMVVSHWMTNKTGIKFYELLLKVNRFKKTSESLIAYDEAGDRKGFPYAFVNVDQIDYVDDPFNVSAPTRVVHFRKVGEYGVVQKEGSTTVVSQLRFDENRTVWPGNRKEKPPNFTLKKHLKIVTVRDPPFVITKRLPENKTCSDMPETHSPWTYCYHSARDVRDHFCCTGLSIDLLIRLSQNASFTFDLHLSNDGFYGKKNISNGIISWNGVVGELHRQEVDMAVAALTINEERDEIIDFSKPWLYYGITILEKQKPRLSPMKSFMQPFTLPLWVCVFSSVIIIGFVLFLLDKYSPFSRFYKRKSSLKPEDEDEHPLNFSGSMWFVWGVLLDSGIGERTPRSLSARVMGMVWCGFSMIMVASYTANLAAFLVLDQPERTLTGISDTRLRNPTINFAYATVDSTNVYSYFKKHIELQTMFRTMEGKNYNSSDMAIGALMNGHATQDLDAFIYDSTRLEYEAARSCELITSGGIFGRSAYGIGLPKGSDWTGIVSLAILHMHESGEMEDMDAKWITGKNKIPCKADDTAPVRLGIMNMRDLFILVAGGIVFGFVFISIEIVYKKRKQKRLKQKQLVLHYGRLWRNRVRERIQREQDPNFMVTTLHHRGSTPISTRKRRRSADSFEFQTGSSRKTLYSPLPVEYATIYNESPRSFAGGRWTPASSNGGRYDPTVNPNEEEPACTVQSVLLPPSYGEYQAYVPRRSVIV